MLGPVPRPAEQILRPSLRLARAKLRRARVPVKQFVDGSLTYVLSRQWKDLLAIYVFRLHPLPYCKPGECTPAHSASDQLIFACCMLVAILPLPLPLPSPCPSQVLLACSVLIAVSLLGLLVSCCPASHSRGLLATGYLCLGLPAWVRPSPPRPRLTAPRLPHLRGEPPGELV